MLRSRAHSDLIIGFVDWECNEDYIEGNSVSVFNPTTRFVNTLRQDDLFNVDSPDGHSLSMSDAR